jgi:hypothetical protein
MLDHLDGHGGGFATADAKAEHRDESSRTGMQHQAGQAGTRRSRADAERLEVDEDLPLRMPCFVPIIDGGAGFVLKCADRHQRINLSSGKS